MDWKWAEWRQETWEEAEVEVMRQAGDDGHPPLKLSSSWEEEVGVCGINGWWGTGLIKGERCQRQVFCYGLPGLPGAPLLPTKWNPVALGQGCLGVTGLPCLAIP